MERSAENRALSIIARSAHAARSFDRACASCGSRRRVMRKPEYGMTPFCADCIDRSVSHSEWDDLGEVD
jgi:hypothetical protein